MALYGQPSGSSMTQARYNLYTRKQGKPMHIMSLPPTDLNLFLHVKRAQLQMLKYYGRQPTSWVLRTFPSQHMAGRYKTGNLSSCHHVKLSFTMYCLCTASDACHNPFTKKEDEMDDAAPNNYDHEHDNDRDEQDEDEDDRLAD